MSADKTTENQDGDPRSLAAGGCSVSYFGSTGYQVIEPLGGGFYLVAHPNGPAICGNGYLSTIDGNDDDAIQLKALKSHARRKFREWAWPKLAGQFFAPNNAGQPPEPAQRA